MTSSTADVLVVGAGIAGLMAARRLKAAGFHTVVLEKAATIGGRLATARVGRGWADTGAQFFTNRAPEFREEVNRWLAEGLVYEWSRGWSDGSLLTAPLDGYPRYAVRGGFASLANSLADGIDVRASTRLAAVDYRDGRWQATAAGGETWQSRALILTPPVPASLDLLAARGVVLPDGTYRVLEAIQYAPCLCGLFAIDGELKLPEPGALQRPRESISWIADNQRKGISPNDHIVTLHANRTASELRWAWTDDLVLSWMLAAMKPWLSEGAQVVESRIERWRHAVPVTVYPDRCLVCDSPGFLAFAGDAFDGPRVEGAALSGRASADALITHLLLD